MKEKKNIERLFQEKFKNFEKQPPADAWKNIRQSLHPEQQKRKVIPLWVKLSGIAAILLLGFFIINTDFPGEHTQQNITNTQPFEQNKNNITLTENPVFENQMLTRNEAAHQKTDAENITPEDTVQPDKENRAADLFDKSLQVKNQINQHIAHSSQTEEEHTISEKGDALLLNNQKQPNAVAEKNHKTLFDREVKTNSDLQKEYFFTKEENPLALEETNELQQLLEEQKSEKQPDELIVTTSKWKITPNIAPVTMNSLSQGSPISDEFINNSKDFESSLGYGLGVNYAITPKLNIRTGVNKLTVGYNTNDVMAYASVQAADILTNRTNIKFDTNNQNIVLRSEESSPRTTNQYLSPEKGQLNQRIGYIEVPVELSYKLLDKRFGIDLIGGMSTLFLNENEIAVISNGMSIPLGEANNLSDIHFSTNVGFGFRYEIFKSFEANIEPMFKYQLGTFSKNDGNFKPYLLGLYTGLSFKF